MKPEKLTFDDTAETPEVTVLLADERRHVSWVWNDARDWVKQLTSVVGGIEAFPYTHKEAEQIAALAYGSFRALPSDPLGDDRVLCVTSDRKLILLSVSGLKVRKEEPAAV
jgi:hypothetical protein